MGDEAEGGACRGGIMISGSTKVCAQKGMPARHPARVSNACCTAAYPAKHVAQRCATRSATNNNTNVNTMQPPRFWVVGSEGGLRIEPATAPGGLLLGEPLG